MYKDLYYANVFIPETRSSIMEQGYTINTVVRKINTDNIPVYEDINNKNIYYNEEDLTNNNQNIIGKTRITKMVNLNDYFFSSETEKNDIDFSIKSYSKEIKRKNKI